MTFEVSSIGNWTGGAVLLLDAQGLLARILFDGMDISAQLHVGDRLTEWVAIESADKARNFLATLRARKAAFDWEIDVPMGAQMVNLHFNGVVVRGQLLIAAGGTRQRAMRLIEDWQLRLREQPTASGAIDAEPAQVPDIAPYQDTEPFNDMSRLVNDLTTAQRELARQNAEILRQSRELVLARQRAESANRVKSVFLATMSHELRTPLNSIIGFTGLMLQGLSGSVNAEQSKQLEIVRRNARHLLSLINDVLDFSKIEAEQLTLHNEYFDLKSAIETVVETVRPLANEKGLKLRVEVAADADAILGDRRRVEQILLNLLGNSIKFTEQGDVVLKAAFSPACALASPDVAQPLLEFDSTHAESDSHVATARLADGLVRITVKDSGPGIDSAQLTQLFQPFHQIDSEHTRTKEGTGLGLAICRRLVERMGGEIHVVSEQGQGSEFIFTLPTRPQPAD